MALMVQKSPANWKSMGKLAAQALEKIPQPTDKNLALAQVAVAAGLLGTLDSRKLGSAAWPREVTAESNPQALLLLRLAHLLIDRTSLSPISWNELRESLTDAPWTFHLWDILALVLQDRYISPPSSLRTREEQEFLRDALMALEDHQSDPDIGPRAILEIRHSYLRYLAALDQSTQSTKAKYGEQALILIAEMLISDWNLFTYRAAVDGNPGSLEKFPLFQEDPFLLPPEVFEDHPLLSGRKDRKGR
jgi:hypothetical protein